MAGAAGAGGGAGDPAAEGGGGATHSGHEERQPGVPHHLPARRDSRLPGRYVFLHDVYREKALFSLKGDFRGGGGGLEKGAG